MFSTGYFESARGEVGHRRDLICIASGGFVVFADRAGLAAGDQSAQTWGKKVLGIRIAHLDGTQPTLGHAPAQALPARAGRRDPAGARHSSRAIVDVLFIFRGDRRCVHDLIAGTQVVEGLTSGPAASAAATSPQGFWYVTKNPCRSPFSMYGSTLCTL